MRPKTGEVEEEAEETGNVFQLPQNKNFGLTIDVNFLFYQTKKERIKENKFHRFFKVTAKSGKTTPTPELVALSGGLAPATVRFGSVWLGVWATRFNR